jgi:GNAT superfamily N-acetyltransferase
MSEQMTNLTFQPVTPEYWKDFETLFGKNGACAGCWCMWWKLPRAEFDQKRGNGTRRAIKKIITSGQEPGILAYDGDQPVGWCAIAPREAYPRLEQSRLLKPVDDQPVWSIVCFYVARKYRRQGLTKQLITAAIELARSHGASIVEAYPIDARGDQIAATGLCRSCAAFCHTARDAICAA